MKLSRNIQIDQFHITDLYASGTECEEFDYFRNNASVLQEWGIDFVTLRLNGKVRAIGGVIETDRGPFAVLSNTLKAGDIRVWDLALLYSFIKQYLTNVSRRKGIEMIFADIEMTKKQDGRFITDFFFASRLNFIPCAGLRNVIKPGRHVIQMAWREKSWGEVCA